MENINNNLPDINTNTVPSGDSPLPVNVPAISSPVKFSKIQIAIAVLSLVLIILAVIVVLLKKPSTPQVVIIKASPVATQSASLPPREVSEFGKTEAFTKFENKVTDLQKTNETVDLYESKLSFPLLDMNVNFKIN
jgi:hypothetical protein